MALAGIGTDTTGSIRAPASLCGLVGVRPTPRSQSLDGVVPLAWSYDTVGPLARSVADAELLLAAMSGGSDAEDRRPVGAVQLSELRLGLLEELLDASEEYVAEPVRAAARQLERAAGRLSPVRLELLRHGNAVHQIIQHAEAAAVHRPWFEAERANYSDPVRLRLEVGALVPANAYLTAQRARGLLIEEARSAFAEIDVMIAPSTPFVAPRQGAAEVTIRGMSHPLRPALLACVLGPTELACPIVGVPVGLHDGLPFGMQLIGRPRSEALLFAVARAWEEHFGRIPAPIA
jgi:aspartyl-tRNA(Asn)/glutamyl-tRNA(Gln) amidotransferase subunit A